MNRLQRYNKCMARRELLAAIPVFLMATFLLAMLVLSVANYISPLPF